VLRAGAAISGQVNHSQTSGSNRR